VEPFEHSFVSTVGPGVVLAKYEYDTPNGVSYSVLQARIVFVLYRIHIHKVEYEYILNIPKYI
jgi:hypothetical protein